ncbi:tRNA-dihydrouridine synthase 2, putative [Trypanosoma brucei gambiense DAL972]|uniref:tRNA-dihydrouridine synthase 2, putative n=1 Tax=Trypanosoma brucei gambiense (strain MHOM/CI/86/DAL972) TaxID=679716 RepID=D0A2L3_TRYB9|nr:tRNA-dihydrouridine synthase 2, putative [Trypanosoma brucei gambiense DAL972]CBH15507.1 tRNA-dihydrouridine synthase 2, putative [Trypanosoma brucei gambiense DAL972]|eukprot:XP_011777771.1 tRNA-dihydrouridine synthase 2, putative [Trypanosoma brucei gambiense DAL972]
MSIFNGKTILAPMVRVGTVGFRVFCAAQGADIVFSEEVVASKLIRCKREVRTYAGCPCSMVEFVSYEPYKNKFKRSIAFATVARGGCNSQGEGAPVVLQLGVAEPAIGARAALLCVDDVDGIDVNMGCPKKFSVDNGMGAALMRDPARAAAILVAVDEAVNSPEKVVARRRRVPISFKTRLLDTADATAQMLLSVMEGVGPDRVHAITLHARTPDQLPDSPPHYERVAATISQLRSHKLFSKVCFVLNGSISSRGDGRRKAAQFGFDAAMIARHAMLDMSVFSKVSSEPREDPGDDRGPCTDFMATPMACASWMELYRGLLRHHVIYRTPYVYTKYHLTRSVPNITALKHLMIALQRETNCYEDAARIFGLSVEEQQSMQGVSEAELLSSLPVEEQDLNEAKLLIGETTGVDGDSHVEGIHRLSKKHKGEAEMGR